MPDTPQQHFLERGYAVVPGFKSPDPIMAIRTRACEMAQQRRVNDHFPGSAETIRGFLEEEAVDAQGRLQRDKSLPINKIGHALLAHYSGPDRSAPSRLACTLHATDGRTRYAPGNWLQRRAAFAPGQFV